jgi:hypothetical protein
MCGDDRRRAGVRHSLRKPRCTTAVHLFGKSAATGCRIITMFVRLIVLVAMLVNVSVAAESGAKAAHDGRSSIGITSTICEAGYEAEATDRLEPLRVTVASSPRHMLSPPGAGDLLDPSDDSIAPGARCVMHTSGCPPPRA